MISVGFHHAEARDAAVASITLQASWARPIPWPPTTPRTGGHRAKQPPLRLGPDPTSGSPNPTHDPQSSGGGCRSTFGTSSSRPLDRPGAPTSRVGPHQWDRSPGHLTQINQPR